MIPKELKERKQWICWKYETVPGRAKPTKIPYNPVTGFKAKSSDASTWTDFETARANMGRYSGIGFVFTKDDPYVGIDLDAVLDKNGKFIQKDAQEIFNLANSYTEISPSGTGIHIIGKAHLRDGKPRKVEENKELGTCEKEVYESGRYFTVTGRQMGTCNEVNDVQELTNMMEDRMEQERGVKNGKGNEAEKKKVTQKSVAEKPSQKAISTTDNSLSPGLMKFTKMVFPHQPNQVKMAGMVQKLLSEVQVTRVVKSRDLFVEYTRNGMKYKAILKDEGRGIHIPEDATNQKAYIYGRLIRHIARVRDEEKEVSLGELHEGTKALLSYIENECKHKGMGAAIDRVKVPLHELGDATSRKPSDVWEDIKSDMAMVPRLNKTIQFFKLIQQDRKIKYLMVSKEIMTLFKKNNERVKEQEVTQGRGAEAAKDVQRDPREEQKIQPSINSKFFRPVVRNLYLSSETKAVFAWLEQQGVRCKAMNAEELNDKQIINCSLDGVDFRGKTAKGIFLKDCAIDGIATDEKTNLREAEFETCRFASSSVFDRVVSSGAVIKNCMVREAQVIDGEKKMLWSLQNAEGGKREKEEAIQCLSMPGNKEKTGANRGGFER